MTKLLPLLAMAAVTSAGTAFAADFSPVAAAPAAPVSVVVASPTATSVDWTGVYAGGQLSFGRLDLELDDGDAGEQDLDGAVGGLHAGYLRDFGRVVAGAELAYDRADLSTDDEDDAILDLGADLDAVTRLGARVGYDAGRVLPYATAGYANATFSDDLAGTGEDNADGYYFGAGVEYAFTNSISLKVEGLYVDFSDDNNGRNRRNNNLGRVNFTGNDSREFGLVRAGLNFRFNSF